VARYRAKHPPKAPPPPDDTPLPRHPHLLLDGEVPVDEAASGRTPQPGPSQPDGSYTPHGLRDGYAPTHPIDLAAWKQQDYNQLARHQAAEAADRAFDAEIKHAEIHEVKPQNPPIGWLVAGGIVITALSFVAEIALLPGEATPPPADLLFASGGVVIANFEVSYWVYVYRVATHPYQKQHLILLPPWGLK